MVANKMSNKMQLVLVTMIAVFLLAFASSPPVGNTGAPGDGNCGNCHGGGNFPGSIVFDWGTGTNPDFLIEFDTGVPNLFGYQMTILDDNDNPVGTYTMFDSNSDVSTNSGQEWLAHSPATFSNSGFFSTAGQWDSQGFTGDITVYLAINATNGNANTGGDDVQLFQFPQTIVPDMGPLSISIVDSENPICTGLCTGSLVSVATGGQGPYSYVWSNGEMTSAVSDLCAGSFTVTVTDDLGDTAVTTMDIIEPDPITVSAVIDQAGCFGENMGAISLTVNGGTPDFVFDWGIFGNSCCISNLFAGTYFVSIVDENGCDHTESFTVNENADISLMTSSTMASTNQADGTATVIANGGSGGFAYNWSNGGNTATISGLVADIYTVTVTDAAGCTEQASVSVSGQICDLSIDISSESPDCFGENGTLTVSSTGGTMPISFVWSDSTTLSSLTGPAGTYSITATDAVGCVVDSIGLILSQPDSLDIVLDSLVGTSCAGVLDGELIVSVVGGVGDYLLIWENGLTNDTLINGLDTLINLPDTLTNLPSGYFSYMLEDGNGCTRVDSFLIPLNDTIAPVLTTQAAIVYLDTNGSAGSLEVSQVIDVATDNCGIMDLTLVNAPTSYSCADIGSTMVTVEATDTNNNSISEQALVTVIDTLAPILDCPQNINMTTGATIVLYDLPTVSDNCDTNLIPMVVDGLDSGSLFPLGTTTVVFEATDLCGNVGSCSFEVTITNPICDLSISVSSDMPECFGENGSLSVSTTGGTAPISFVWSDNTTQSTLTGPAGTYSITVTDAFGCVVDSVGIILTQPDSLNVVLDSLSGTSCVGILDGELIVSVEGGVGDYLLTWENGLTNDTLVNGLDTVINLPDTLTNLPSGYFSYLLEDGNGCTRVDSFLIPLNDTIPPVLITQTAIVYLDINGSAGPLTLDQVVETATDNCGLMDLTLSNDAPTSFSCADIGSTMVTIVATDTNSNTRSRQALVTVIDTLAPTLVCPQSINLTTCIGIDYNLPTVTDNCDVNLVPILIEGLSSGNVFPIGMTTVLFEATDLCGNIGSCSFEVTVSDDLELSATSTPATCGLTDGTIILQASNGTPPFVFTPDVSTGVGAGTFNLTVTDAAGCQAETTVVVDQVGVPSISAIETVMFCPGALPIGSIEVTEGQAPFDVLVDGQVIANEIGPEIEFTLNGEGTFNVTIADANGCAASNTIEITTTEIEITLLSIPDINLGCAVSTPVSQVNIPPGNSILGNPTELMAGEFTVVDDLCGVPTGTFTVTGGGMVSATATTTSASCIPSSTGSVSIFPVGGTEPYTYEPFGPDQDGLVAGDYTVTVTDITGCVVLVDFTIEQEASPQINASSTSVCFGENNGEITVLGTGGNPPYTYSINFGPREGGDTDPFTFGPLVPGVYNVSVFDVLGCSTDTTVTIEAYPELVIMTEGEAGSDCILSPDELIVTPMGGVMPFEIAATLQADNSILVAVLDSVGCTASQLIEPVTLEAISASVSVTYDCMNSTPIPAFNIAGGCPPFNNDFDPILNTQVGEHIITITDSAGQTALVTLVIEDIGVLAVSAPATVAVTGVEPILIDNEITGGFAPYSFQWLDVNGIVLSIQPDFNVQLDSSQVVTLIVQDARGCAVTTDINIEISTATIDLDIDNEEVQVFPSPVSDELTIQLTNPSPVLIQVMDMTGRLISSSKTRRSVSRIDVADYTPGLYFIRMEFEDKLIVKRFIKS